MSTRHSLWSGKTMHLYEEMVTGEVEIAFCVDGLELTIVLPRELVAALKAFTYDEETET